MSPTITPPRKPAPKSTKTAKPTNGISTPAPRRELVGEKDILKQPAPTSPPKLTRLRIGIHTSTSGGVEKAVERAYRLGCNAFQIFSSSPRQWKPIEIGRLQCEEMKRLRAKYNIAPLAIHTSYLVNMCSTTSEFLEKSVTAFRGEIERALAL